jgi:hypothetical protein
VKDDDESNGALVYWYTTDVNGRVEEETAFDIRELPEFASRAKSDRKEPPHEEILMEAIRAGRIAEPIVE